MKISIIIRTYNEIKHIEDVLKSIIKQTYKNYEIIVVDSESTDGTLDVVEKYTSKIIKIKKQEFNYSFSSNIGCKNATGEILLFLSGHSVICGKKYLAKLVKYYKKYDLSGCYGDLVPFFNGGLLEKIFYYGGYYKNIFTPRKIEKEIHPGILSCSNASILKKIFDDHQFVIELGDGAEDVEMAKYILSKNGRIMFFRNLLVRHSHHKKSKDFKKELIKYKHQYNNAIKYINKVYSTN